MAVVAKKGAAMQGQRLTGAARYTRFARHEADGRSALYEAFALGVAADGQILDFLLGLPEHKRQPNLLFAAVRHLFGTAADWPCFRATLLANLDAVRAVMLQRATQTNEPGRCAVLLPVLARLPQPLALIEVGASAGLCLLPDLYAYDYGNGIVRGPDALATAPVFSCVTGADLSALAGVPHVVWCAGLDLNPLDVADPTQPAWLETLVWPEQTERLTKLRAAMAIAAAAKPRVVKGSLLDDDLPALCSQAPRDATLVILHTAVLAYVADAADRQAFAERVKPLCHTWISNESPWVFPDQAHGAGVAAVPGRFLMSVNGSPVAWTDPHGAALEPIQGGRLSL